MSTLKERVLYALKELKKYSTASEVYEYMKKNGIDVGKSVTPSNSISTTLITCVQNEEVMYYKTDKGRCYYGFKGWNSDANNKNINSKAGKVKYSERSLHKLLCNYIAAKEGLAKTIYQEKSKNKADSAQKWIHPDIVSVSFVKMKTPVAEDFLKSTKTSDALSLCSYELKLEINTDYDLKKAYFQALSNSYWANYGYLVAFDIVESPDMINEMERLNLAFGIGIIKLGVTPAKTRVLFQSRKKELDYRAIDKLCAINDDFMEFIKRVHEVVSVHTGLKKNLVDICDNILLDEDEIKEYCQKNNIPFD